MEAGIYEGPINRKRLGVYLAAAGAIAVPAFIFLPFGLVRLGIITLFLLPFTIIMVEKPWWMFLLLIFFLFSDIDVLAPFHLFQILVALMLVSLVLAALKGWRPKAHDRVFIFLVLFFLVVVIQSLAVARDMDSYFYRFDLFIKTLLYAFIISQVVRTRRRFEIFLAVTVLGIAVNDFLPFLIPPPAERYGDTSMLWDQAVYRYEGYVMEPNYMAFYQIFLIPLLIYFIIAKKRARALKIPFILILAGSIGVLVLTFSRGGFVSLVFLLLMIFVVERRNKGVFYTGIVIMAAGAVVAPAVYWERITSLVDLSSSISGDFAVMSRIATMKVAVILGLKNPVFGVGMENYIFHASRYIPYGNVVHNSILQVFSETGFPGLLVLLAIIGYNFRILLQLAGAGEDPEAVSLGRVLLVQQSAVLFSSMFIPVAYNMVFWIMLALPSIARNVYLRRTRGSREDLSGAARTRGGP